MALTADELRTLQAVERAASALSIAGIVTIIVTFFSSRYFRNPTDRLILINAFYNALDVTATMISLAGPRAGNHSALCQFQGFLMQMFPLADVLWTLAMAIDVFLIVFYQYDARALHRLEKKYIAAITGFCFIPAFVFLFVHTAEKGPMYGSVTLWCAIAPDWVLYRIVFYYAPIWLAIAVVLVLYCLVGWRIVKGKRALQSIESDIIAVEETDTTESLSRVSSSELTRLGASGPITLGLDYARDHTNDGSWVRAGSSPSVAPLVTQNQTRAQHTAKTKQWHASRSALSLRQYLLMPVMFFVVLLFIWVAPSTNRVASFVNPHYVSFPLYLAVGATGSLRGFWNGIVFLAVGMRSRQSQMKLEKDRPRPP